MEFIQEHVVGGYLFSTDKSKLQLDVIHGFLGSSYWSPGLPVGIVQKAIEHSVCVGIYNEKVQIGFARLVTDQSTFAYLADVFILPPFRGKGISKELMRFIQSLEFVPGLRRFLLATRDAHGLYAQFDFKPVARPESLMEIHKPDIYTKVVKPS